MVWICLVLMSAVSNAQSEPPVRVHEFNYAEALQKTLYFIEAQQSGQLSPNNRVEWRGAAFLDDGKDIGHDLSGGWFDAGDHWTANLTMSFLAMTLVWSAIEKPQGWQSTGQMDELLESLIHVNRYFLRCVLNPECADPSRDLEIAIGSGGREGVEAPNVHAMWGPAEVAHLMTNRPTFRLNHEHPGSDIPAAMACAMTASAIVIRANASCLEGKPGYAGFDAKDFSQQLIACASKLTAFAHAHIGRPLEDSLSEAEKQSILRQRNMALRSDGKVVEVGYRAGGIDKVFVAATWLARAATDPVERQRWIAMADAVYEGPYKAENDHGFWKDYGAGNFGKIGAYNMLRLNPDIEKFHNELQVYCHGFTTYDKTPGGLRLRERFAHEYGSLRHSNNAAVIALYYSDLVLSSPPLTGNTWWKGDKSNKQLQREFVESACESVNYALGANPYGRSYLVGFGNQPFNHPHHRGAYGAWAGFDHFIPGKADDRTTCRHVLYGALIAGPDHNDVFLCGNDRHPWLPIPNTNESGVFYRFPNRTEPIPKEGYVWDANDVPVQDVMDSVFNEVALDYNAGFMASLVWLCAADKSCGGPLSDAEFPPKAIRNASQDFQKTDLEFFVTARRLDTAKNESQVELTFHNHSRWPARIIENPRLRYYFELDGDEDLDQVSIRAESSVPVVASKLKAATGKLAYVDVAFQNQRVFPGGTSQNHCTATLRVTSPQWNADNDWSCVRTKEVNQMQDRILAVAGTERLWGSEP